MIDLRGRRVLGCTKARTNAALATSHRGGRPGSPVAQRSQQRDREELAHIYQQFAKRVEAWVRNGARGGDPAEIADLVQEVFIRLFRSLARGQYDGDRPFGAYVHGIAHNVVVDRARRVHREIPTDLRALAHRVLASGESAAVGPRYRDPSALKVTESFLGSLPAELRAVHQERFVAGRSQRAAAAILGLTRQRLRTLEERLFAGLRQALEESAAVVPTRRAGMLARGRRARKRGERGASAPPWPGRTRGGPSSRAASPTRRGSRAASTTSRVP
jgi:RNA polymerase sigma factor (sigma-70 family)